MQCLEVSVKRLIQQNASMCFVCILQQTALSHWFL